MQIVWIDLETGGTDEYSHQITQVAAVATAGPPDFVESDSFEHKVVLVDGKWEQEALDLQAYDAIVWEAEAKEIWEVLREFDVWLRGHTHERISKRSGRPYQVAHMAGHNVDFDGRFLRQTTKRHATWLPLTNWTGGVFDTLQLAKWYFLQAGYEPENFQLETLCTLFGVDLVAHDAMNDVRGSLGIARKMMNCDPRDWRGASGG